MGEFTAETSLDTVVFSPDHSHLAVSSRTGIVEVYHVASREKVFTLSGALRKPSGGQFGTGFRFIEPAGLAYCMVGPLTYELRDPKEIPGSYFRVQGDGYDRWWLQVVRGDEWENLVLTPPGAHDVRIFLPHRPSAEE